jgi:hypothetical protein
MAKVTNEVLDAKLTYLTGLIEKHVETDNAMFKEIRESLDGDDEYPGVRGRLDRLELATKELPGLYLLKTKIHGVIIFLLFVLPFLGWDYIRRFFVVEVIKP